MSRLVTMRKRTIAVILSVSIIVIVVTSLFFFNQNLTQNNSWQITLSNFATTVAYDNGKVFVVDNPGNLQCLDTNNGKVIWTATAGGWTSNPHLIAISNGIVYVGVGGGAVDTYDERTGKMLPQSFQAPVSTSWGQKEAPQAFTIADGRIIVTQNGMAVYNVSSGELFWQSGESGLKVGNTSYSPSDINPILVSRTIRFNPNNGSIIWQAAGDASDPALIAQDKVILWNYNSDGSSDEGQTILCVDKLSGETLWKFDVGSKLYQPTEYNGLVLFGAYDGNFYALNLFDGSLAWKTEVTDQNGKATMPWQDVHYPLTPSTALVEIDNKTNRAFWAFAFAQTGWGGVDDYSGIACALDLANGHIVWKTPISKNTSTEGGSVNQFGLCLFNGKEFLTTGSDLWVFNEVTGGVDSAEHFDHYVLNPVAGLNQVFIAGDLKLSAHK